MLWYYVLNNERAGPVTQEQFDQLAQTGAITPDTLVWRAGIWPAPRCDATLPRYSSS